MCYWSSAVCAEEAETHKRLTGFLFPQLNPPSVAFNGGTYLKWCKQCLSIWRGPRTWCFYSAAALIPIVVCRPRGFKRRFQKHRSDNRRKTHRRGWCHPFLLCIAQWGHCGDRYLQTSWKTHSCRQVFRHLGEGGIVSVFLRGEGGQRLNGEEGRRGWKQLLLILYDAFLHTSDLASVY